MTRTEQANRDRQIHVLILPSEPYQPPENQLQGIFQRHQAEALVRAGLKVGVLAPPELQSLRRLGRAPMRAEGGLADEDGVSVMRSRGWSWVPGLIPGALAVWRWRWRRSFERYRRHRGWPDILHAHSARVAGVFARELASHTGLDYVLTEHDSTYGRGLVSEEERRRLRPVFAGARRRIVVSPRLGTILEQVVGPAVIPWMNIPNLLDSRFERGGVVAPESGSSRPVLLSAGSLDHKKGFDVLLRAFSQAFPSSDGPELRIAGSGPLLPELRDLAGELGVSNRVVWLGLLDRASMLEAMQCATCFVLASRTETFGVVVIEALACGCPVVVTASGGPESIVVPGDGIIVPVEDVDALAFALKEVLRTPDAWDADAIRQRCLRRYGEAAVAAKLVEVYEEAIT